MADILQKDPDMRPDVENLLNERLPKVCIIPMSILRSFKDHYFLVNNHQLKPFCLMLMLCEFGLPWGYNEASGNFYQWKLPKCLCMPLTHRSKLDHCYFLLYNLLKYAVKKLQHVLNAAVHLISLSSKYNHVTPTYTLATDN